MMKKKIFPLLVAGMFMTASGTENGSGTGQGSTTSANPFDYGAPTLNRHSALAIRNVSRQLKLRGIVGLAKGDRKGMIDLGDGGNNLIVAKGSVIRVPVGNEQKGAAARINWIELIIVDISETEMTLQSVDDQRQRFVLR